MGFRDDDIDMNAAILPSKIAGGGLVGAGYTFYVNNVSGRSHLFSGTRTFATIQAALDTCVSERGDVVCVLPGAFAITAPITMTKNDVALVAYSQRAIGHQPVEITTTDSDASCTDLIQVDADDCVISGFEFDPGNDCVNAIDVADTTACKNLLVDNCRFEMSGGAASNIGVRIGDDTNDASRVVVQYCQFQGCKAYPVKISGSYAHIHDNFAALAASTVFFATGDAGADVEKWGYFLVENNDVTGNTNAPNEAFFTALGVEANTGIGVIRNNHIHGAVGTDDIHPEMWINNYLGNEAGGLLYDPKA